MKKGLFLLFLFLSATVVAAGETEVKFTANYIMPGDDETWDKAIGAEGQVVFWIIPEFGIAPSIAISKWSINEMYEELYDPYYDLYVAAGIEGNATAIPIGISLLVRPPIEDEVGLMFEAGLRYVPFSSNVKASALVTDGADAVYLSDKVRLGSSLIVTLAADVTFAAGPRTNLYAGLGYQIDMSKGKATWLGEDIGDNKLYGLFIRTGLGFTF
jgi:hypothetical protein